MSTFWFFVLGGLVAFAVTGDFGALGLAALALLLIVGVGVAAWVFRGGNDVKVHGDRVEFTRRGHAALVVDADELSRVIFSATDGQYSLVWLGTYPGLSAFSLSGALIWEAELALSGRHDQEAWWSSVASDLTAIGVTPVWSGWHPKQPLAGILEEWD